MVPIAITAVLYGGFLQSLAAKQLNLGSDTLKVMLLSNSYTPSDSHRYQSDVSSYEIAGTGYTSGGATLTGVSVSYASNTLTLSAANVSWTSSTITAYYAAIYDSTPGSASINPLISYLNFGGAESDTNGTFQIAWNASGIAQITHS